MTANFELDSLFERFLTPSAESLPTPFFWWSGDDIDRDRLASQLDALVVQHIGGTIVGYSHRPNGTVDHGSPEPFSPEWWDLMRWFIDASSDRGMTVGFQDYGFVGPALVRCGERTMGTNGGTLTHDLAVVRGGDTIVASPSGVLVSALAWPADRGITDAILVDAGPARGGWRAPPGEWLMSVVSRSTLPIGALDSAFDPLHPDSGRSLIDEYYAQFANELGDRLGTSFLTFFEDELDFGLTMPFFNSPVHAELTRRGFQVERDIHLLWIDAPRALVFREAYRDIVIGLLEHHYFRPIFEWHERHGTRMLMDQISRGDLRLGRHHYGDFLRTMRWFHGPGNDDPNLNAPRNIAAFRVSASIARAWARPIVANEAFHSSGWGVTPQSIMSGANVGFAAGANTLILHGLNYTTDGGWFEWASPDVHFRQPWWSHSGAMWLSFGRTTEILRMGTSMAAICVIDPTSELDLVGLATRSPERARELLDRLSRRGICVDLASPDHLVHPAGAAHLEVGDATYKVAIIVAELTTSVGQAALKAFEHAGGTVIDAFDLSVEEVESRLRRSVAAPIVEPATEVLVTHRQVGEMQILFIANPTSQESTSQIMIPSNHEAEVWDPLTVVRTQVAEPTLHPRPVEVVLKSGGSAFVVIAPQHESARSSATTSTRSVRTDLLAGADWTQRLKPVLDDAHGDFGFAPGSTGIESWTFESSDADGAQTYTIGQETGFLMLGPFDAQELAAIEATLLRDDTDQTVPLLQGARRYMFSREHGIDQDPYLRDRMSGPHGLKGVPSTFLDPHALDDECVPGSVYYFWSTVDGTGLELPVWLQSRSSMKVWVDGAPIMDRHETPAKTFAPWDLQDMSAEVMTAHAAVRGGSRVVVRLEVSAAQPTRAAIAIGGTPGTDTTKLTWWGSADPALDFRIPGSSRNANSITAVLKTPPGAVGLIVAASGAIVRAEQGVTALTGRRLPDDTTEFALADRIDVRITVDRPARREGRLFGQPIQWVPGWTTGDLRSWDVVGLSDYSGHMLYRTEVTISEGAPACAIIEVEHVETTCEILLNGYPIGTVLTDRTQIDVTSAVVPGTNVLEIVLANTLANHYRHLPSPYSGMQKPGGEIIGLKFWVSEG